MSAVIQKENRWHVTSESDGDRHYVVTRKVKKGKAVYACSCPHFIYRHPETCKHIDLVIGPPR